MPAKNSTQIAGMTGESIVWRKGDLGRVPVRYRSCYLSKLNKVETKQFGILHQVGVNGKLEALQPLPANGTRLVFCGGGNSSSRKQIQGDSKRKSRAIALPNESIFNLFVRDRCLTN